MNLATNNLLSCYCWAVNEPYAADQRSFRGLKTHELKFIVAYLKLQKSKFGLLTFSVRYICALVRAHLKFSVGSFEEKKHRMFQNCTHFYVLKWINKLQSYSSKVINLIYMGSNWKDFKKPINIYIYHFIKIVLVWSIVCFCTFFI